MALGEIPLPTMGALARLVAAELAALEAALPTEARAEALEAQEPEPQHR